VASFEAHVNKLDNRNGYIDCFWPGTLIAEHKSRGKNLDSAYLQAIDYFASLKERDLPRYVVVSDFATIRLYDLDESTQAQFTLKELRKIRGQRIIVPNISENCSLTPISLPEQFKIQPAIGR